jgi:hypothetical protein
LSYDAAFVQSVPVQLDDRRPPREYLLRWLTIYTAAALATGVAFLIVAMVFAAWRRFSYPG